MQVTDSVLQYLKVTPKRELLFKRGGSLTIEVYTCVKKKEVYTVTDVDYAGLVSNKRSTLGYCTFLSGNLVAWKSKKQSVVA